MAAEYLLASGTEKVILCERGIRTFEKATRNTLDLSAIPVLRGLTHLPIIVDPSHAVGIRDKIPPMGLASVAGGADGIIVEVHCHPEKALSDGPQALYAQQFDKLMHDIEALAPVLGKSIAHIRLQPLALSKEKADKTNEKKAGSILCAYSGNRGAYAEQAIARYFDSEDITELPTSSFSELFQSVTDGKADFGMVPIENSLAGSVYENYDNLSRFEDVSIIGSVTLNIRHALLGVKGGRLEDVKNVYSHPQALSQCKKYLENHPECVVSLGHTDCDYETAISAINNGAKCLTHTYNAMPPLHHRNPGPIGAAFEKHIYAQLICDGFHISKPVVLAAYKMFGADRLTLISDSIRSAGLPDGEYESGGLKVILKDGAARLQDGTIAGSSATLLDCVKTAVKFGIPFEDAVKMASETPANMLGIKKGRIEKGYDADLLIVDNEINIKTVIMGGKVFV